MPDRPSTPRGLGAPGRKLWREIAGRYDMRPDEWAVLEQACRSADLIGTLVDGLEGQPLTVEGSKGQMVAHPLVSELRLQRAALRSLLHGLELPDEAGYQPTQVRDGRGRYKAKDRGPKVVPIRTEWGTQ